MPVNTLAFGQQTLLVILLFGMLAIALQIVVVVIHQVYQRRRDNFVERVRSAYIEPVTVLLADESNEATRRAFIACLPADPAAREVVAELVLSATASLRGEAKDDMLHLLHEAGFAELYLPALADRHSWRRSHAAHMLGEMRVVAATSELRRLLNDRSAEVRLVAARALGRLGLAEVVDPLLSAFASGAIPSGPIAGSILQIGAAAGPALQRRLGDGKPEVRGLVVDLLGLLGWYMAVDDIVPLLGDASPAVRLKAAVCLGRLGYDRVTIPLIETLSDSQEDVRAAAAQALGRVGDARAVPALVAAMADADHMVRSAAAEALTVIGDKGTAALLSRLSARDQRARSYAVEALQRCGYADRMAAAWRHGHGAASREAPARFLRALALAGGGSTLEAAGIPMDAHGLPLGLDEHAEARNSVEAPAKARGRTRHRGSNVTLLPSASSTRRESEGMARAIHSSSRTQIPVV